MFATQKLIVKDSIRQAKSCTKHKSQVKQDAVLEIRNNSRLIVFASAFTDAVMPHVNHQLNQVHKGIHQQESDGI